jgi:hypothetical protein
MLKDFIFSRRKCCIISSQIKLVQFENLLIELILQTDPDHRANEFNRNSSDFNDLENTVIDMKSATTRKGESKAPGASSKLTKPGKSRKSMIRRHFIKF